MKALVTGAAGFIGSTLADALTARGIDVIGVDCFTDYYPREVKEHNLAPLRARPSFTFIEDQLQTVSLDQILDDVTHVFHLAAQAGVRKSWGRLRHLHDAQRGCDTTAARSCKGPPAGAFCLRVKLLCVR